MRIIYILTLCIALLSTQKTKAQDSLPTAAEEQNAHPAKYAPGVLKERLDKYMGGVIEKENSSKGWICFANSQNVLSTEALTDYIQVIRRGMRLEMKVAEIKKPFSIGNAEIDARATGAFATVFIIKEDNLPITLVAPESGWAMVNVNALAKGIPLRIAQERIKKAILRTFCILCGAYDSGTVGSILWPATCPEDFDALQNPNVIPPTLVAPVGGHMVRAGMRPIVFSSYRKACEAGWAPPPTNDVQRTIWNQVHQIPDKPITIEFDPKKDK